MYDWKKVILTCSGSEINDFIIIITHINEVPAHTSVPSSGEILN